MGIADLVVAAGDRLAGGLVQTTHQPGVGQELTDTAETAPVMRLVEQHQREHAAHSGDGLQTLIGLPILHTRRAYQVLFQLDDHLTQVIDQAQIHAHVLTHACRSETFGNTGLVAVPMQLLVWGGQVVLTVDDVDVGQQAAPVAYQVHAAP